MAEGVKVTGGANVGFCNGSSTSAEKCQIAEAKGEVEAGLPLIKKIGMATGISISGYVGKAASFERDPTDLTPIRVRPTGDEPGDEYHLFEAEWIFVPFLIDAKGSKGGVKAKHNNLVPSIAVSHKGKPPLFVPYIALGSTTAEPSTKELRPAIDHPFAAVITGTGVPSTFAVRGGLQEIDVNRAISLNVEGGAGLVTEQAGPFGSGHAASGWSILVSGRIFLTDTLTFRGGFQHTRRNALQEPALNKFTDGKGTTHVTGGYAVLEGLFSERVTLYGGGVKSHVDPDEGETAHEQTRVMSYGAIAVSLPWEMKIALMHGQQVFTEGEEDAERGRMEGGVTSVQLTKDFGHGVSLDVLGFRQEVDGEKIGMEEEQEVLNPVHFDGSGGMALLKWEFDL
ncbi:MAG: hypothetical protein HYT76_04805 [Deltaproteobacteria bacterium]|nr:hypothetical protein [Deltaproteobacteria bacterium]